MTEPQQAGPARPGAARACPVCRGPGSGDGRYPRCYGCEVHRRVAGALLADAVVPVAYAVKGGPLARDLWRYKHDDDRAAAGRLARLLDGFLREHGPCVQWAAGAPGPGWDRVAVVPSGSGRPGRHPLGAIVASCLTLPEVRLVTPSVAGALARGRSVSATWPRVDGPLAGEHVLVIDDTWVSGSSAQSSAVALKQAGAGRVAVVVLGRHLDPGNRRAAAIVAALASGARRPGHDCAPRPHSHSLPIFRLPGIMRIYQTSGVIARSAYLRMRGANTLVCNVM
ncbi:MAG TPA: hypothetical protein VH478_03865 [Trebonia sp.]|jgi:hypothetical protein|nr:hypothetical protein [Trebonia sp.]